MTTKRTMIKHYRNHSAADSYILGFTEEKKLYMVEVAEIMPRFLTVEQASRNQGENLRLRIKKNLKKQLMQKNPICLGSAEMLKTEKYNKGEIFEKLVTEYFGQVWEKDNIPFWKDGDLTVNGIAYQIKFESATFTNEKQMARG